MSNPMFADFDAIADQPIGDVGSESIIVSAKIGGGVKRSVRLLVPAIGDAPESAAAAAQYGCVYSRSAPIGDRGAKRDSRRTLAGAAALSAVNALTGFAPPVTAERPNGRGRNRGTDTAALTGANGTVAD